MTSRSGLIFYHAPPSASLPAAFTPSFFKFDEPQSWMFSLMFFAQCHIFGRGAILLPRTQLFALAVSLLSCEASPARSAAALPIGHPFSSTSPPFFQDIIP